MLMLSTGHLSGAGGLLAAFFCANPGAQTRSSAKNHFMILLSTQDVERRLDLTVRVLVADTARRL